MKKEISGPVKNPQNSKQRTISAFFSAKSKKVSEELGKPALETLEAVTPHESRPQNEAPSPPSAKKERIDSISGEKISVKPASATSRHENCTKVPNSEKNCNLKGLVGKKLKILWPDDGEWYEGRVEVFYSRTGKHKVVYDDGDWEVLMLQDEKYEIVSGGEDDESVLQGGGIDTMASKKRKNNIVYSDSEDAEDSEPDDSEDEDWGKSKELEIEKTLEAIEDDDIDAIVEKEENNDESLLDEVSDLEDDAKFTSKLQGKTVIGKNSKQTGTKAKNATVLEKSKALSALDKDVNCTNVNSAGKSASPEIRGNIAERFSSRHDEKFPFLVKNRRDAKLRTSDHPDYSELTVHLPEPFLKSLTGGQRQWWQFKALHLDKVLFFKMGKFYELFEMDAHIGAQELDLQYMKGDQPHCGFPEKNYTDNALRLVRKGYKVLVVEQTETPDQMEVRKRETGSKDKVVRREIVAVLTKGTLTDVEMISSVPDFSYLLAIAESTTLEGQVTIGACAVDTSTGQILVGQFVDDAGRTRLRSILSELRPVEIVKRKSGLSSLTESAIRQKTRHPIVNDIPVNSVDVDQRVQRLASYYSEAKGFPLVLKKVFDSKTDEELSLKALDLCLDYLKEVLLDAEMMQMRKIDFLQGTDSCSKFNGSISIGITSRAQKSFSTDEYEKTMIMDSTAIENLEILENSDNGSDQGTLLSHVDHCVTFFGKRRLKKWLIRPLVQVSGILERQKAISDLKGIASEPLLQARQILKSVPDLERLLSRLHSNSLVEGGSGRNASKVVLYEDSGSKHLCDLISALRGCSAMKEAADFFQPCLPELTSLRLKWLLTQREGFPEISSLLEYFKTAFDWSKAESSGRIVPSKGVNEGYDRVNQSQLRIERELSDYLEEQKNILGKQSEVGYVTVGKDPYQLEVPEKLHTKVPRDYELKTSRKGFKRYWTAAIRELLAELAAVNEEREAVLRTILGSLRTQFCEHMDAWSAAVKAISELDVLGSLSLASKFSSVPTCRPTFLEISPETPANKPCFQARSLFHPILASEDSGKLSPFVPNNTSLGGDSSAPFLVLSGPNMGGKSTLIRQVCLAIILAQMGADVPAESLTLTAVDRVFVRMGAKDRIMSGQSTFFVELEETAAMLKSASEHSFVALDELGRGTSTSDGQAIAHAVLCHLAHSVRCRGIFSTHYHRLAQDFQSDPTVSLSHMACKVNSDKNGVENVTFLYRLQSGSCPKSYGANVARLAGMPERVIQRAVEKANEFELSKGTLVEEGGQVEEAVKRVCSMAKRMKLQGSFSHGDDESGSFKETMLAWKMAKSALQGR